MFEGPRRLVRWSLLASLFGAPACGGGLGPGMSTGDAGGAPDAPATTVDTAPGAEDGGGDVPNDDCLASLVTTAELASTPRADTNLELLALKLSKGRLVADQAIYSRVVRDVGAIRAQRPDLATIAFFPRYDGVTIGLVVETAAAEQMKRDAYAPWECLNRRLGAVTPFEFIRIGNAVNEFVFIKVKGLYALDVVAPEYRRLPGVIGADDTNIGGDGPTICVTPGADEWHYVVDAAFGDCPAGCINHAYSHFTTDAAGALAPLEQWSSQGGGAVPGWVTQYASPAVCR